MVIDYPFSKEYAFTILEKLAVLKVMDEDRVGKYKKHIENIIESNVEDDQDDLW